MSYLSGIAFGELLDNPDQDHGEGSVWLKSLLSEHYRDVIVGLALVGFVVWVHYDFSEWGAALPVQLIVGAQVVIMHWRRRAMILRQMLYLATRHAK